jgi:hypothetical protein
MKGREGAPDPVHGKRNPNGDQEGGAQQGTMTTAHDCGYGAADA